MCKLIGKKVSSMMTQEELENLREQRGSEIVNKKGKQVNRIDDCLYTVKSQSGNGEYAVCQVDNELVCECPDYQFRHVKCKHIFAVELSKSLREATKKNNSNRKSCRMYLLPFFQFNEVWHYAKTNLEISKCSTAETAKNTSPSTLALNA